MKHQYESEILFQLMERDGFNIPSSVPPYESEVKAYLINQVKLAYPKLTDYEAEWLLYNYTKHLPADFPISSATNVTEATFENVVPFAYQSAILTGNTLVNIFDATLPTQIKNTHDITLSYQVNANETYTFIVEAESTSEKYQGGFITTNGGGNGWNGSVDNGISKFTVMTSEATNKVRFSAVGASNTVQIKKCVIIKGDYTNQDIPFFTGMQSVKMPVLTTTGKNLISKWYDGKIINDNGELIIREDQIGTDFILIETKGDFVCESLKNGIVRLFNVNKQLIGKLSNVNKTFNVPNQVKYITFNYYKEVIPSFLQLEQGSTATPYEPYKSNILTVNEDVTLRSNGNICDELNLLTGQLTQRIDEDGEVLSQEVVKTVDLKTVNETGESVHFMPLEGTMNVQSSGEPIQPTFDMSVPVEATTQNLASFIDLEMEE